jgi:hypothetical protein
MFYENYSSNQRMNGTLIFPEAGIRRSGRQLAWLAILGQILTLLSMIALPLVLFSLGKKVDPGYEFLPFLHRMFTDPAANGPANLYQLVLAVALLLVLECVRRWGKALASSEPMGETTLSAIGRLQLSIIVFGLLRSFDIRVEHAMRYWPCTAGDACMAHDLEWNWSSTPLYLAALVAVALLIVRRLVSQSRMLKAENEGFV